MTSSRKRVAIVGAGVSGLAAAWALRDSAVEVTVFEKSRGVSGRAASRTRHGVRFDHGANYFKTGSERLARLVHDELPTGELERIAGEVWTFDGDGQISPGDPALNAEPKWTYRSGISTLGKLLATASGATLLPRTTIGRLDGADGRWRLHPDGGGAGEIPGAFDAVLLTPPAPQTAALLRASELPGSLGSPLLGALDAAPYHRQFSVVLGTPAPPPRHGSYFALLNSDRRHPIAWLSFESDKPERVPEGEGAIVVQMAPRWSAAHFDDPPERVADAAAREAGELLGCKLAPHWAETQRWKFAHPAAAVPADALGFAHSRGLFFAGDALVGKGRVGEALETGLDAASAIIHELGL